MSNKNLKNSEDKMSKNSEEQQLYVNKSAEKQTYLILLFLRIFFFPLL